MYTFGDQARIAVLWSAGLHLFQHGLQSGVGLVLVRFLTPEAYGQFGLLTSTASALNILSCATFLAHTLQVRHDHEVHYQEHFTASLVLQAGLCLLTNLVALALRQVEAYAAVAPLLHVMSIAWLLDAPSSLQIKMLERALAWQRLRVLHALGLLVSAVLALGLAAGGAGVYALVLPGMAKRLVFLGDLLLVQGWRPTWAWSAAAYAPAWHFGLARLSSTLLVTARPLLESSLLVQCAGFVPFGVYGRATGLAQLLCASFAQFQMQAIYPLLTRAEPGTAASARACGLVLRVVAWVAIPAGLFGAVLADPLVRVLYGTAWVAVVPLLPWAIAAGTAGALAHAAYMLVLASQQPQRCTLADLYTLVGTGICLLCLAPHGLGLYLRGLVLVQLGSLGLLLGWLAHGHSRAAMNLLHTLWRPLLAAAGACMACEGLRHWLGVEMRHAVALCAYGAGFVGLYVGLLRCLCAAQLGELLRLCPGGRRLTRLLLLEA